MEITDQILISEQKFCDGVDDPIIDRIIVGEVTSHETDLDNVEIQIGKNYYIRFRVRDLLQILGISKEPPK